MQEQPDKFLFEIIYEAMQQALRLCQLSRNHGMSGTQATADSPRLAIDIAALITTEEQCYTSNLISNGTTLQRIQLADLALGATLPGTVKDRLRHARFDEAGADGVDADTRAGKLVRDSLGNGYNRSLRGRVIGRTGVGAKTGN